MKIVLVRLSGDETRAADLLNARFRGAEIVSLGRSVIETGSIRERIAAVRRARPDIFAVMTESLAWQYGQIALMSFGALCGAQQSVVFDARGGWRTGKRATLLTIGPALIAQCFVKGKLGIARANKKLATLERVAASTPSAAGRKDPAKITYLRTTPSAGTQPGGATSHINGVVKGLVELGAEVRFIGNDEIAGLDAADIAFERITPQPDIMPRAAFDISNGVAFAEAAAEMIASDPPSIVYERYSRFSFAGVEAARRARVPLFLEYNGSEVWVGKHWDSTARLDLLARYERLNLAAATRIFVISEVERQNLIAAGIPDEKIVVNPNGVDTEIFTPGIGGLEQRRELGIAPDTVLAGFVGTFGPWHGVLELAEAIRNIPKEAGVHFLLVGDGSLRPQVEQRLGASGDLDRVTFTGVVSHERVPTLLDACDILVSPHVPLEGGTEFFGSPTKLFEYMAMGKAIVASRLGQIGDVLTDNETALLVEPGSVRELSDTIMKLSADDALRARLGNSARETAVARHTWRRNAERIMEEIRCL